MAINSAQLFVKKMRENKSFRNTVSNVANKNALWYFVKKEGFDFNERDLVEAMAECMTELEESNK
jgi:predicted ribosomally synthesized peptide with nif11-like leader